MSIGDRLIVRFFFNFRQWFSSVSLRKIIVP